MNYLSEYQPFQNKHELNEVVAEHLSRCKYELNETDRDVLMMLSRHSVKYAGASHLKAQTIARSVGKSVITIRRVLNKLTQLRIIEKRAFLRRVTGGTGANVFIFLHPDDKAEVITRTSTENSTPAKDSESQSENEPITFSSDKELLHNTYSETSHKAPYIQFKNTVNTFLGDENKTLINRLYGVYLAHTKKLTAYDQSELMGVAIRAIHATMHASKQKTIHNVVGYYHGVISRMISAFHVDVFRRILASC